VLADVVTVATMTTTMTPSRRQQADVVAPVPPPRRAPPAALVVARQDSFNRPDSPLFHETLPLPAESAIRRHRQRSRGRRAGASSASSSESDGSAARRGTNRRRRRRRSQRRRRAASAGAKSRQTRPHTRLIDSVPTGRLNVYSCYTTLRNSSRLHRLLFPVVSRYRSLLDTNL